MSRPPTTSTTDAYTITFCPRPDRPHSVVFVDPAVAGASDLVLAALAEQETRLGERRWAQRGQYRDVDELYDKLNAQIAAAGERIAREAITTLIGSAAAAAGAEHSRYAGCRDCPCTPGVIAPHLRINGAYGDLHIDSLT